MIDFNPTIIGHSDVVALFKNLFSKGRIPQAIIFNGLEGIGKDFFADELSKTFSKFQNNSAQSAAITARFSEPDLKFVIALPRGKNEEAHDDPLEKLDKEDYQNYIHELGEKRKNPYHKIDIERANLIKINSIRDVNKFLSMSSDNSTHRTVLISHADLMNEEAQNSLLKNLEEPPPNVTFILTTSKLDHLRPTIISRCWLVKFSPLSNAEVEKILIDYFNIEVEKAKSAALLSNGSVTDALELIENDLSDFQKNVVEFLRSALAGNVLSSNQFLTTIVKSNDKKNFHLLIKMILFWLTDTKRDVSGIRDYGFASFPETFSKFNSKYSEVKLNNFIARAENLSATVLNNNLNLNIATHKLIFELSTLIKQND